MHGIVSLLDPAYYSMVETIWHELENDCGLKGIKITPLPHFSWQIAESYHLEQIKNILSTLAASTQAFTVHSTGVGLFTGAVPVIYIPLVKDMHLMALHKLIWERVQSVAQGLSPYYEPGAWIPHITLANRDVNQGSLNCAMDKLAFRSFDWEIRIDHLALVNQTDELEGWLQYRFDFPK